MDEDDCCLVSPHDTLKSDLEPFVAHKDSFIKKMYNDSFSSYSDSSLQNIDQELVTISMEDISELEWFSNVECSDMDICKLVAMLDGLAYESISFDICNEFVLCLQECFNDEYVMEVLTNEDTNFHGAICRTKYEVFYFPLQFDGVIMKLDECCFWHVVVSNTEHGYFLFQAMLGHKV